MSPTDRLSPEQRSNLMSRVRQKGTDLELLLRKAVWGAGLRYRLKTKAKIPGTPDLLFPVEKVAIFVDGCFWHGCPIHGTKPQNNAEFWASKISRNRQRDVEVDARLSQMGWLVVRLWQHDLKADLAVCVDRIIGAVSSRRPVK